MEKTEDFISEELIEKTFLFCYKRVNNSETARDLTQDIIVDSLLALRSGKKIENFYAFYWTIANHVVTDYYRRTRPQNASCEELENVLLAYDKSFDDYITKQEIDKLSHSITRLAKIHRDIIIRFYLKGESVKKIAEALNIPVGTVTGRLSDARKNLEETFNSMENKKQKGRQENADIVGLEFLHYGNAWKARESVRNLLDRQILFCCRNEKKSINQIADEVHANPVYVEESVKRMEAEKVMFEQSKEKYITDFTIFPKSAVQRAEKAAEDIVKELNLIPRYFEILNGMKADLLSFEFYGRDFDWYFLLPYFIVRSERMFAYEWTRSYLRDKYAKAYKYDRTIGYYFLAVWKDDDVMTLPEDPDKIISGFPYNNYRSAKYGDWSYANMVNGFCIHRNGKEYSYPDDRLYWFGSSNIDLYFDLVKNPKMELNEHQMEVAAIMIKRGALSRMKDGSLRANIPVVPYEVEDRMIKLFEQKLGALAKEFAQKLYEVQKDILFPYVRKDLMKPAFWNFFPMCGKIEIELIKYGIEQNMIALPQDNQNQCLGLVMQTSSTVMPLKTEI